jgi:branched-chain amino acid transport system permease protein
MTSGLFINLLDMVVFIGIYGIVAVSLNLEYGFTGLGNFGKVAFLMIGAYTTAILAQAGVNFWLCIPISAALAAFFGFLVSLPALRLREDYLAIVTLTFGEIIRIFIKAQGIGGGVRGISIAQIFHFDTILAGRLANIGLAFGLLALCFVFAQLLANSPYGRIMRAIREDQTAAQSYGKGIQRYKAQVFTMGSAIAGIAGALLAQYTVYIEPDTFLPGLTFTFWIMVMLGGPGNNWGALLGAAVVMVFEKSTVILKDYVHLPIDPNNLRFILYGVLILLVLFYRPSGLIKESPVKPPKTKIKETASV